MSMEKWNLKRRQLQQTRPAWWSVQSKVLIRILSMKEQITIRIVIQRAKQPLLFEMANKQYHLQMFNVLFAKKSYPNRSVWKFISGHIHKVS